MCVLTAGKEVCSPQCDGADVCNLTVRCAALCQQITASGHLSTNLQWRKGILYYTHDLSWFGSYPVHVLCDKSSLSDKKPSLGWAPGQSFCPLAGLRKKTLSIGLQTRTSPPCCMQCVEHAYIGLVHYYRVSTSHTQHTFYTAPPN